MWILIASHGNSLVYTSIQFESINRAIEEIIQSTKFSNSILRFLEKITLAIVECIFM